MLKIPMQYELAKTSAAAIITLNNLGKFIIIEQTYAKHLSIDLFIYIYIYVYIYIYIYILYIINRDITYTFVFIYMYLCIEIYK